MKPYIGLVKLPMSMYMKFLVYFIILVISTPAAAQFSPWSARLIGHYKKYFEDESDSGSKLESERLEGTFFIDFAFVRVYGTWFQEKEDYTNIVVPETKKIERDGVFGGLKIFF